MRYHLSFQSASRQVIDVSLTCEIPAEGLSLRLSAWRPGRYSKQEFVKYISDFKVRTDLGDQALWSKTDSHTWKIEPAVGTTYIVSYSYYANQQDAGGTWFDDQYILFNGITALLYCPGQESLPCQLRLTLPDGWRLGGGLPSFDTIIPFSSFHHLVDTPFFASPDLWHHQELIDGMDTHLWIQGNHTLDVDRLLNEIRAYTPVQIQTFGDCPVEEYHYLYLFRALPYRHGVEHHNSTVIVMGPGRGMHLPAAHQSLLEISSHEFFHTWNVKAIRPADMYPYSYEGENYSRLHYITEGVTTYYGDLMLWKSGIWTWDQWVDSINGELSRHYGMGGKDHISLEMASFDSWINGYDTSGFPNRRISFYTKGSLVSLIADHLIRQFSEGERSLDDVMHAMYHQIAKHNRGYTSEDYRRLLSQFAGKSMADFHAKYIEGTQPLELMLEDIAMAAGLKLIHVPPPSDLCSKTGISWKLDPQKRVVIDNIWPGSPAEAASIYLNDQILGMNGDRVTSNPDILMQTIKRGESVMLTVSHQGALREVSLQTSLTTIGSIPQFISLIDATSEQLTFREQWKRLRGPRHMSVTTLFRHE